jgi:hypothetical protein
VALLGLFSGIFRSQVYSVALLGLFSEVDLLIIVIESGEYAYKGHLVG